MSRLVAGISLAVVLAVTPRCGVPAAKPAAAPSGTAAARAVRYLLDRQQPDGSWRSAQYAVLRSGQAYTPFVLHALMSLPPGAADVPREAVDRAVAFIRAHAGADGSLGYEDPDVLEYPVYATSYAVRALARAVPGDPLIARMGAWLAAMQIADARGFDPTSPAYGAWSFGAREASPASPGHVDLAHTRRVLEALRDAGAGSDATRAAALRFLGLLQKRADEISRFAGVPGFAGVGEGVPSDGGFFFSPIVLAANKALHEPPRDGHAAYFRSYATATADGALALLAAGVPSADPRVAAARAWLAAHADVDVEGIPADHPEPWVDALRFYHLATFCEAAAALDLPGDWRARFAARLDALQRADGSFANASPLMKEDDPILATALAIVALTWL